MHKDALYQVRDLPPDKRHAAEALLAQRIEEDEIVIVRAAKGRLLKKAPTGPAREEAFRHDRSVELRIRCMFRVFRRLVDEVKKQSREDAVYGLPRD